MSDRNVVVSESGVGPYGQSIVAGSHRLTADEPEALGGRNSGPDPFELLLAGLGACTAMTIRMYAQRKGMPLRQVEVQLSHPIRASQAKGQKDRFERHIRLVGDLTPEQRQRLLEIADRCPVSQTLKASAEVATSLAAP
ncbi:MAG: OsmC family protein [Alphaproteobacteria bacterium]|nr:OsmC family protein [Alphaproteobacteria bacterium]